MSFSGSFVTISEMFYFNTQKNDNTVITEINKYYLLCILLISCPSESKI